MQKISQIFRYPKAGLQFLDHEIADLPKLTTIYGPNGRQVHLHGSPIPAHLPRPGSLRALHIQVLRRTDDPFQVIIPRIPPIEELPRMLPSGNTKN